VDRAARLEAAYAMTRAPHELAVRHGAAEVGRLQLDASDRFVFAYSGAWRAMPEAFPVSLSLPLRDEPFVGGAAHAFFANLLPEGNVRQAVCARLGVSPGNDFALLRAIGGECAGALAVVDVDAPLPDSERYRYEAMTPERMQALVDSDTAPLLFGGTETRLSLAGAQDKLPVAMLDGQLHLAHALAPTTHILKLPSRHYKHMPVNEAFVMGLAGRVGIEVVPTELLTQLDPPGLLVLRYDRRPADGVDWPAVRLHQEDLCQALGRSPDRKYEQEGGPSLIEVIRLLQAHSRQPLVDVRRAIEWQAFNVVAGNCDGHGKNLALLYDQATPRLAPIYDLVSTRYYDGVSRRLAMRVGERDNPDELGPAQWAQLAAAAGLGPRVVQRFVADVAQRCRAELDAWTTEFRGRHGDQAILQRLPGDIAARARRLARRA
jgi:serine/threonine-protein kinase HipA